MPWRRYQPPSATAHMTYVGMYIVLAFFLYNILNTLEPVYEYLRYKAKVRELEDAEAKVAWNDSARVDSAVHRLRHLVVGWADVQKKYDKFMAVKEYKYCRKARWGKSGGSWPVCINPEFLPPHPGPCLVYSFGINFDFAFDNDAVKHGCEVHSFDPSMGQRSHKVKHNHYFHNIGLGGTDRELTLTSGSNQYLTSDQHWKIRTLTSIVTTLNHTGKVIDILKVDIEGGEWETLEHLLHSGILGKVRQLAIELHVFNLNIVNLRRYHNIVHQLRSAGFAKFRAVRMAGLGLGCGDPKSFFYCNQWDVGYVNMKFAPKNVTYDVMFSKVIL